MLKSRTRSVMYLSIVMLTLTGCATTLTTIEKSCGTGRKLNQCSGTLEVPAKHAAVIRQGAQIAIDRIYSDAIASELARFMDTNKDSIQLHPDWANLTPSGILSSLRVNMDEARLGTHDGLGAWYYHHIYGSLALESIGTLPARINRWGISGRRGGSIANTIVHEASHAADLTHNDKDKVCSPPYVLGEIIQRLENDDSGDMISHCRWFDAVSHQ